MDILTTDHRNMSDYGTVIDYDSVSTIERVSIINVFQEGTTIPETGNVYIPHWDGFLETGLKDKFCDIYGDKRLQFGYCHGHNAQVNALEWHDSPELIFAVTPCFLFLGLQKDLQFIGEKYLYKTEDLVGLKLEQGEMILLNKGVLHFSPVKTTEEGFMTMIVLKDGTNTPLKEVSKDPYLFMENKWLIAHEENSRMIDRGAKVGVIGINYCLEDVIGVKV